jgi:hypothetical protein
VNTKQNVALILSLKDQPVDQPPKMALPHRGYGKKLDTFYERLATYVDYCQAHGIAFGPRLADDNGVAVGTVDSWVREARRRAS